MHLLRSKICFAVSAALVVQACASSGGKIARETCVVFPLVASPALPKLDNGPRPSLACTLKDGTQRIRDFTAAEKYICMPPDDFFAMVEECRR